ncbi:MAG TPA: hypothetical protein DCP92_14600, partial [Nitrospiraceae bacterium]|nr:hypothetical protein [Nitrospiraceae bacterium]
KISRTIIYGRFRRFSIFLDGKKKALIGYNETISLSVPPGHHSFYAKLDWVKSNEIHFEISETQSLDFRLSGRSLPPWKYWLMLILFGLCIAVGATFGPLGAGIGGAAGGFFYSRTNRPYLQEETVESGA